MQTLEDKVVAKIYGKGRGWAFTPSDFASLGDPRSVGVALSQLNRKNIIRRLARGIYDYPKQHPKLGTLFPSPDAIAQALAGRDATRLQPSGAYAANLLGLSEQVPMRVVFLTEGTGRKIRINNQEIVLKRTTPRNMATAGKVSGLVIQALRHLGPRHGNDSIVQTLSSRLSHEDKMQLLKDARYAPAWIADIIRQVATATKN
jgi:hypothetical protein